MHRQLIIGVCLWPFVAESRCMYENWKALDGSKSVPKCASLIHFVTHRDKKWTVLHLPIYYHVIWEIGCL